MSGEERAHVLKMIAEGKITAEEGLQLLRALETSAREEAAPTAETADEARPAPQAELAAASHLRQQVHRFGYVFLWAGVGSAILSAWGMYTLLTAHHLNFWFYCLLAPLLLGAGLIALAAFSQRAHWLIVDIHRPTQPTHLFFGFPVPLKVAAWSLRTFSRHTPAAQPEDMANALEGLQSGLSADEPVMVHVSEGEDGERVQVYFG